MKGTTSSPFYRIAVDCEDRKAQITRAGAVPPLVRLLSEGTQEGRADAVSILTNLAGETGGNGAG